MKRYLLGVVFSVLFFPLSFTVPAERLPESCRDSTPSLRECYAPYFMVGAASSADDEKDSRIKEQKKEEKKKKKEEKKKSKSRNEEDDEFSGAQPEEKSSYFIRTVGKHFSELSSGSELLPAILLEKKPKKFSRFTAFDGQNYAVPAKWNSQYLALFLEDAKRAGVQVRFHLLVCPEMSPDWFFFHNYDTASRLASMDEMLARLEWYIKTVADFIVEWESEHNQGESLVTSCDVVSELFSDSGDLNRTPNNHLMKIFGDVSYAVQAFAFAARFFPDSVKLCYCDHSLFEQRKAERVKEFISSVRSAGGKSRVNEIGIISHLTEDWPDRKAFFEACRDFSSFGMDVQIQQLDIMARKRKNIGNAYYDFLRACIENSSSIKGVSFRAVLVPDNPEFVDYMRAPLFTSNYSCTGNFNRVIEATALQEGIRK